MNLNSGEREDTKELLLKIKKPKKRIISFATINKYFIIPFLCPILCMLANYHILYC